MTDFRPDTPEKRAQQLEALAKSLTDNGDKCVCVFAALELRGFDRDLKEATANLADEKSRADANDRERSEVKMYLWRERDEALEKLAESQKQRGYANEEVARLESVVASLERNKSILTGRIAGYQEETEAARADRDRHFSYAVAAKEAWSTLHPRLLFTLTVMRQLDLNQMAAVLEAEVDHMDTAIVGSPECQCSLPDDYAACGGACLISDSLEIGQSAACPQCAGTNGLHESWCLTRGTCPQVNSQQQREEQPGRDGQMDGGKPAGSDLGKPCDTGATPSRGREYAGQQPDRVQIPTPLTPSRQTEQVDYTEWHNRLIPAAEEYVARLGLGDEDDRCMVLNGFYKGAGWALKNWSHAIGNSCPHPAARVHSGRGFQHCYQCGAERTLERLAPLVHGWSDWQTPECHSRCKS